MLEELRQIKCIQIDTTNPAFKEHNGENISISIITKPKGDGTTEAQLFAGMLYRTSLLDAVKYYAEVKTLYVYTRNSLYTYQVDLGENDGEIYFNSVIPEWDNLSPEDRKELTYMFLVP